MISFDNFGRQIKLYYKGQDTLKSNFGAFMTLIYILLLVTFILYRTVVLVQKSEVKASKYSFVQKLSQAEPYNPYQYGFNYAFGIQKYLDPTIATYSIIYTIQRSLKNSTVRPRERVSVQFASCNNTNFPQLDAEEYASSPISNMMCAINDPNNIDLQGDFYSDIFKYVEVRLTRCVNGTDSNITCKSKEDIIAFLNTQRLSIIYINQYFDFKSFGQEINSYLDDSIYFDLEKDRLKQTNVFIQRNRIKLTDDYFQYGQQSDREFFQISNIRSYEDDNAFENQIYNRVFFRIDKNYDIFERQIYSFGQLFGELGGLKTSLFFVISNLVAIFTSQIPFMRIANKVFQSYERSELLSKIGRNIIYSEQSQHSEKNTTTNGNSGKLDKSKLRLIFQKAQQKIKNELDVTNIITKLRTFQNIVNSSCSTKQKLALQYQKSHVVETDDSDYEYSCFKNELQKMIQNNNMVKQNQEFLEKTLKISSKDKDGHKSNDSKFILGIIQKPQDTIQKKLRRQSQSIIQNELLPTSIYGIKNVVLLKKQDVESLSAGERKKLSNQFVIYEPKIMFDDNEATNRALEDSSRQILFQTKQFKANKKRKTTTELKKPTRKIKYLDT
ncbi:UNKNOWN [Stylonychia lemnae]|uniref:Transmembrane protein n=1 Tax=Stylonychia lemnae TaxID=5949 RepID=A0A078ATP5_STYLE|nr:UNKNOWN [Stylonychia lemnae]|eukprot:CDW85614.1 UNKNOWN [Stylonychia lemnae]